jgi:hypothetical protein
VEQERRINAHIEADRRRGFNGSAPQLRLTLFQVDDDTYEYVHLFTLPSQDGWSYQILVTTLLDAYQSYCAGREPVVVAPVTAFGDFCIEQSQRDMTAVEQFWRSELADVPFPAPSVTLPAAQRRLEATPPVLQESLFVDSDTAVALAELARGHGLSVNSVVQGAWALLVSGITGSPDVVCGTVFSGRGTTTVDVDKATGLLFNILPVATTLDRSAMLLPWLATVQDKISAITENEYVTQAALHAITGAGEDRPLFDSYLVSETVPGFSGNLGRFFSVLGAMPLQFLAQTEHPLRVEIVIAGDLMQINLNHRNGWFRPGEVAGWLRRYVGLLDEIVADPHRPLGELIP